MPDLETVGEIQYSGSVFHGTFVEDPSEIKTCLVATDFPYRNYLIIPIEHPVIDRINTPLNRMTLGPGLYGTTKEEATKYAIRRARGDSAFPVVNQLEVSGRFYDFRAKADITKNGRVSVELAEQWLTFLESNEQLIHQFVRSEMSENLTSYATHLKDFIERLKTGKEFEIKEYWGRYMGILYEYHDEMGRDVRFPRWFDLRDLLRTYETDRYGMEPVYGGLWVRFMQKLGCDGVIFNEGGEDRHFNPAPSYVVYNPQIILDQQLHVVQPA